MKPWNADEFGMAPDDHAEVAWSIHQHQLQQRYAALYALWAKPVVRRTRKDGVKEYQRARTEDWTIWRAVRASIGLVFGIYGQSYGTELAFWDAGPTYAGWSAQVVSLCGWVAIDHYDDGDCWL